MRVIQFSNYGGPEVLQLGEAETPQPGPGQVQIAVAAIGINPADGKWRSGMLSSRVTLEMPHVPGYDVAGVVSAVGTDVTDFKVGDRVTGSLKKGAYAETAVADATACAKLPDSLEFWQAAALPCPALTGVQLIEEGVAPQTGEIVLVTGATGAVGRFALHAALSLGAKVVAAVRPAYFDEARALGAAEVIAMGETPPAGMVFDHVADTVGGPSAAVLCRNLKPEGKLVTVSTTPIDPAGLPVAPKFFGYHADGPRLARIAADVASGKASMPVARRLPLASAEEGQRLVDQGGAGGKVILEP